MRLYTSWWFAPLLRDVDAVIVGISRGTPRGNPGFRYRRLPELAPSDAAWKAPDEEGYERVYLAQLRTLGAARILDHLVRIGAGKPVVCLCFERPGEWCHRRMLAHFIEQETGVEIRELEAGMLGKRPDTPQPSLFDTYREEQA